MKAATLNVLMQSLVKEAVDNKQAYALAKKSGLSVHWFYEVAKGRIKDPRSSAVDKFLQAIDHPLYNEINKHCSAQLDLVA